MTMQPLLFGLLVGGVILFVGLFFFFSRSRVRERLHLEEKPDLALSPAQEERTLEFLPKAIVEKMEEKLGLKKGSAKLSELKKTMVQAGIYREQAPSLYFGLKFGLSLAIPLLVIPLLFGRGLPTILLMVGFFLLSTLGYFVPTLILNHLVESRKRKIREGLPDALDLLVVCVEAGQGLNAAVKRVSEEMKFGNPVLAQELSMVNLEINAGLEREGALRNLAERTGVEEVASLCSMLIQAERFGTSLAQSLKVQSETLRTTRRQKLEELAAKTPVKLVFPLLLFIFPALMVVIIGPATIRIMENLK